MSERGEVFGGGLYFSMEETPRGLRVTGREVVNSKQGRKESARPGAARACRCTKHVSGSAHWGVAHGGSSRGCPPPPRSDLTWTRQRVTLYPLPPRSDLTWASDPLRAALADLKLGGGYPLPQPRSDLTWARQRVHRAEGRRRTTLSEADLQILGIVCARCETERGRSVNTVLDTQHATTSLARLGLAGAGCPTKGPEWPRARRATPRGPAS